MYTLILSPTTEKRLYTIILCSQTIKITPIGYWAILSKAERCHHLNVKIWRKIQLGSFHVYTALCELSKKMQNYTYLAPKLNLRDQKVEGGGGGGDGLNSTIHMYLYLKIALCLSAMFTFKLDVCIRHNIKQFPISTMPSVFVYDSVFTFFWYTRMRIVDACVWVCQIYETSLHGCIPIGRDKNKTYLSYSLHGIFLQYLNI